MKKENVYNFNRFIYYIYWLVCFKFYIIFTVTFSWSVCEWWCHARYACVVYVCMYVCMFNGSNVNDMKHSHAKCNVIGNKLVNSARFGSCWTRNSPSPSPCSSYECADVHLHSLMMLYFSTLFPTWNFNCHRWDQMSHIRDFCEQHLEVLWGLWRPWIRFKECSH